MKKLLSVLLGCAALLFALGLNFRYAADDYGISKSKAAIQVFGQATSSGSSSSSSTSSYSSWSNSITSSTGGPHSTSTSGFLRCTETHT